MLPIVLADNNAEYTGRKQALPAIIHLATIISLQYLLCHVMQFCIQTTKSCEEEEHRTLAGGGTESGEEESAERSLVSSAAAAAAAGLTMVKHGADVCSCGSSSSSHALHCCGACPC